MRRAKSFSDLLNPPPTAWPAAGFKLFDLRSPMRTAELGGSSLVWQSVLCAGYKKAADLLVEQAIEGGQVNFLVYPIIFCYRQFIELSLKGLISQYCSPSAVKPIWKKHNLGELWNILTAGLDAHGLPNDDDRKIVGDQIKEFNDFDPKSDAARYHVDSNGKPLVLKFDHLDVGRFELATDGMQSYFVFLIEAGP